MNLEYQHINYFERDKMNLEDKIKIVENILKDKKVAVGFSGGADSTLIAYLSSKVSKDTLAITINNHLMPTDFMEHGERMAKHFGIEHEIVDINFYENEYFLSNDAKRCFTCRDLMYTKIKEIAKEKGFEYICDGNNISDLVCDRPGILITYEKGFETPLITANLTSKEIHKYLDSHNIPYSKSTTCLATRIPTNTRTTKEKIERIRHCENFILDRTNCEIVKVRDLGEIGIIEVDKINEIFDKEQYKQINDELKRQGFKKIVLNLSQINDDDTIIIDYFEGSFSYQLPFSVNMKNTKKQIKDIISESSEKIELENITIFENGLIEGHDFENYDLALNEFMEILKKLRRNI